MTFSQSSIDMEPGVGVGDILLSVVNKLPLKVNVKKNVAHLNWCGMKGRDGETTTKFTSENR